jgi:hypothetical protein
MIAPLAANETLTKSRLDQLLSLELSEGSNAGSLTNGGYFTKEVHLGSLFLSAPQFDNNELE